MRLFAPLPDIVVADDMETFWLVSNRPAPGNMILRAHWSTTRTREQIRERIDELFAHIGSYTDQIDWMLFPSDQPSDMGRRLEERGIPGGSGGNWLWADLTSPCPRPSYPHHFHVEQVRDDQQMAE